MSRISSSLWGLVRLVSPVTKVWKTLWLMIFRTWRGQRSCRRGLLRGQPVLARTTSAALGSLDLTNTRALASLGAGRNRAAFLLRFEADPFGAQNRNRAVLICVSARGAFGSAFPKAIASAARMDRGPLPVAKYLKAGEETPAAEVPVLTVLPCRSRESRSAAFCCSRITVSTLGLWKRGSQSRLCSRTSASPMPDNCRIRGLSQCARATNDFPPGRIGDFPPFEMPDTPVTLLPVNSTVSTRVPDDREIGPLPCGIEKGAGGAYAFATAVDIPLGVAHTLQRRPVLIVLDMQPYCAPRLDEGIRKPRRIGVRVDLYRPAAPRNSFEPS